MDYVKNTFFNYNTKIGTNVHSTALYSDKKL